jgi:hypothetical protein
VWKEFILRPDCPAEIDTCHSWRNAYIMIRNGLRKLVRVSIEVVTPYNKKEGKELITQADLFI